MLQKYRGVQTKCRRAGSLSEQTRPPRRAPDDQRRWGGRTRDHSSSAARGPKVQSGTPGVVSGTDDPAASRNNA